MPYRRGLLASTAVWLRSGSRTILGPGFVATATASDSAAIRLVLVASGLPNRHPTRRALGTIETASMLTELSLRLIARRTGPREHELASFMYLAAGLLFRFAWV